MATFNIYGSCICRDVFDMVPFNTHEVKLFLQSSSPISNFIYTDPPKKHIIYEDFGNMDVKKVNMFMRKCVLNDYNKTVLSYFDEKADFFIIDMVQFANTNLIKEVYEDGSEHYWTRSLWYDLAYDNGLKQFFLDKKLYTINRLKIIDEIVIGKVIDKFVEWLTYQQGYQQEQIILLNNKRSAWWSDGKMLQPFESGTRLRVNHLLDEIYREFENRLPNCNVIKMPYGVYSDSNHKWGLTDLHYCYEYYEYCYKCIEEIVNNQQNSKEAISRLRDEYSAANEEKIRGYIKNNLLYVDGK